MSPAPAAPAAPAATDVDPAFAAFHDEVVVDLAPAGAVEQFFAARAASLMWRLQRLQQAASAIDAHTTDAARATAYDCYANETPLDRLARAEHRLQGMLTTTLRHLRTLQHDRLDRALEKLQNKPNTSPAPPPPPPPHQKKTKKKKQNLYIIKK
jgi:hypothetical protein